MGVNFDKQSGQRILASTRWVEQKTGTSLPLGRNRRGTPNWGNSGDVFGYATATLDANATNDPGTVTITNVEALGDLDVTGWTDAENTWGLVGREGQLCRILYDAVNDVRHIDLIQPEAIVSTTSLRVDGVEFQRKKQTFYAGAICVVGDNKPITNITAGEPARVTSADHGFSSGDEVLITGVEGTMGTGPPGPEVPTAGGLNDKTFTITKVSDDSFDLNGSDTTGLEYDGGGEVRDTCEEPDWTAWATGEECEPE